MLESRNIVTTLSGETLRASTAKGCLQGGVLSPLLRSLIVDELLWELNDDDYYTVGYADDIAILINGKFLQTVSEVLQTALCTVQQWCKRTNLPINPNKTVIILFTRMRDIRGLQEPILFNNTIQLSSEVKYLGLILDKELMWKKQLDSDINKALLLDLQRHVWESLGTETTDGVLDIHCGCKTHSHLCCHCVVAQD
jgi:hypothetical protein